GYARSDPEAALAWAEAKLAADATQQAETVSTVLSTIADVDTELALELIVDRARDATSSDVAAILADPFSRVIENGSSADATRAMNRMLASNDTVGRELTSTVTAALWVGSHPEAALDW